MQNRSGGSVASFVFCALVIGGCSEGGGSSSADRKAFDDLLERINYGGRDGTSHVIPPDYQDDVYACYRQELTVNDVDVSIVTSILEERFARETNNDFPPGSAQHQRDLADYYFAARQSILNCQNNLIPPSAINAYIEAVREDKAEAAASLLVGPFDKFQTGQFEYLQIAQPHSLPSVAYFGPSEDDAPLDTLLQHAGKVIVLHLYRLDDRSSVYELRTLASLQQTFEGAGVVVVAVASSVGPSLPPDVQIGEALKTEEPRILNDAVDALPFLAPSLPPDVQIGEALKTEGPRILKDAVGDALPYYWDPDQDLAAELQIERFPSTVVFTASGKEAVRLTFPADWSAPDALALIRAIVDAPP